MHGLLGVSRKAVEKFAERVNRIYGQGADAVRVGEYVRHWWKWARAGLGAAAGTVWQTNAAGYACPPTRIRLTRHPARPARESTNPATPHELSAGTVTSDGTVCGPDKAYIDQV